MESDKNLRKTFRMPETAVSEHKRIFCVGPTGILISTLIFILVFRIESFFGFGRLVMLWWISVLLFIFALVVFLLSFSALPSSKRAKVLITSGPYRYVRHPLYSIIIFCVYPGFAILFGSWLLLASTVCCYLIFNLLVKKEEKYLISIFGKKYKKYMKTTPRFFPRGR